MIMKNFKNIEWVGYNHTLECNAWVSKYFQDYYVLQYSHKGDLPLWINNKKYILEAPVAWLTYPGPYFRFGFEKHDKAWEHRFVSFRGERADSYKKDGLFPTQKPYIKIYDNIRFAETFDELINYLDNPIYGNDRAVNMLEGLLLQLHEQSLKTIAASQSEKRILTLSGEMSSASERSWDFHRISKELGMSYSHFRRTFKSITGFAPNQYLIRARLEKAAKRLRINREEIKEIAEASGFDDIYYFSKMFKQRFGVPPGKYRARATLKQ
jgi:AraC-like DNA-binding protein